MRLNSYDRQGATRGFTLLEITFVLVLIGAMVAITLPGALRKTPLQEVNDAARQMVRDLEMVRMRGMAGKRVVRLKFDEGADFYTAFMDVTAGPTGVIAESAEEVREARVLVRGGHGGLPGVELPSRVEFGRGAATVGPLGFPASDPIALVNDRVEFDHRGTMRPGWSAGVVFLTHRDDAKAVAAVTISGAGAFRSWRYTNGQWR